MPKSSMKVASSNISDIAYDENSQTLSITFKDRSTYLYQEVPLVTYQGLLSAGSKGQYFYQYIKGIYSASKVR